MITKVENCREFTPRGGAVGEQAPHFGAEVVNEEEINPRVCA